jgi:hypothetical protein
MNKLVVSVLFAATAAFAQYKAEPAGAPPAGVDPGIVQVLQKEGIKVTNSGKVIVELWFRNTLPAGPKSAEDSVTLPTVPHGSLLGVANFPAAYSDRRGHPIKPGTYTMRFSYYPQDGAHQGAAPQRDFLILTAVADDKDPNATPDFRKLVDASIKSLGRPHPGVFSFWKVEAADFKPGFAQEGEHDWVLQTKIGDQPVAIILVGKAEG